MGARKFFESHAAWESVFWPFRPLSIHIVISPGILGDKRPDRPEMGLGGAGWTYLDTRPEPG